MDRKKIYIIVIVLCLAVTAGVLYYGFFSSPSVEPPPAATPTAADIEAARQAAGITGVGSASGSVAGLPDPNEPTEFAPPRIFPQDTNLDLNVYGSARFNALQDYTPLTVAPEEVGRDNPFAPYQ